MDECLSHTYKKRTVKILIVSLHLKEIKLYWNFTKITILNIWGTIFFCKKEDLGPSQSRIVKPVSLQLLEHCNKTMAGNPIVLWTVTYKYQGKCARAVNKGVGDSAVSVGVTKPLLPTKKSPHEIGLCHLQINGEVQNWNKEGSMRQKAGTTGTRSSGSGSLDLAVMFQPRFVKPKTLLHLCKRQHILIIQRLKCRFLKFIFEFWNDVMHNSR